MIFGRRRHRQRENARQDLIVWRALARGDDHVVEYIETCLYRLESESDPVGFMQIAETEIRRLRDESASV